MKTTFMTRLIFTVFLSRFLMIASRVEAGTPAQIMLVNGSVLEAELLFKHPNAPLMVIRSLQHRTVQSLHEDRVHAIKANGTVTTYAPRRELNEREEKELLANGLWVDQVEPGRVSNFANETWKPKPLAVWAHPGKDGSVFDPGNWLDENGNPIQENIFSQKPAQTDKYGRPMKIGAIFDGDLLLPQADKPYTAIQAGNRDHLPAQTARHLTVEKNATYRVHYHITGNIWVKAGGNLYHNVQTGTIGGGDAEKHTVARFGQIDFEGEPNWIYADPIAHWVHIDTGDKGSLEVIGLSRGPTDRIHLKRGTLIVSRDSYLGNGNRATFHGEPGTTTILLDGARIGCPDPITSGSGGKLMGSYSIAGKLLFGTPELPLTRDLVFAMCYYPEDKITEDFNLGTRGSGASLVLAPEGEMTIHSANPETARVIFAPLPKTFPYSKYTLQREQWDLFREDQTQLWDTPGFPQGIVMILKGKTNFNGVVFDGFYKDGIRVKPEARKQWRNVSFGEHNLAQPAELIKDL